LSASSLHQGCDLSSCGAAISGPAPFLASAFLAIPKFTFVCVTAVITPAQTPGRSPSSRHVGSREPTVARPDAANAEASKAVEDVGDDASAGGTPFAARCSSIARATLKQLVAEFFLVLLQK
jgi:hypothetical protein